MKPNKQSNQIQKNTIPPWLNQAAEHYRVIFLSDTHTYRLLLAIYWAAVGLAFPHDVSSKEKDAKTLAFLAWLVGKHSNKPAYSGLMWLHQGIGEKLGGLSRSDAGKLAADPRLAFLLLVFVLILGDDDSDDPNASMYYEMIGAGWDSCTDERYKDSLFHGLSATLTTQSGAELLKVGKALGNSEASTHAFLKRARQDVG